MGALRVVVLHPGGDLFARMSEIAKQGLVKKLIPHTPVETLVKHYGI